MNTLIRVGLSTCGLAAGAEAVYLALQEQVRQRGLPITVQRTGCLGACHCEPLVEVVQTGVATLLGPVRSGDVTALLDACAHGNPPVSGPVLSRRADHGDYPFLGRQVKVTTQLCGRIDPHSLEDYQAHDGYAAFRLALSMQPDAVIQAISAARLRGRGGAGFATGQKWALTRREPAQRKFVICNADEGDPGAFMDRTLIEGDPHRILEGMLIAAYAIGASRGYLYVRAEYPLAVEALKVAIEQAREAGLVGANILGSGMEFEFVVKEGAGAFVCGEETALMRSIEGQRGMPTMRPPYPSVAGLWGYPTNINNVETYASVPSILLNGPDWFAGLGTARSGGTKAFALAGAVKYPGLVEVPIGMSLRELIYAIGGGCRDDRALKAVQLGGPSGGCIPADLLDTRIDYEDLRATGAIMGSGGMIVADERTCMVDIARFFLTFTQEESCGKCLPCRVGTRKLLNILTAITQGAGTDEDLERLTRLCATVHQASLCGLGQTAPNPILTTMRYFSDEYQAHVVEKRCPAASCTLHGPASRTSSQKEQSHG